MLVTGPGGNNVGVAVPFPPVAPVDFPINNAHQSPVT